MILNSKQRKKLELLRIEYANELEVFISKLKDRQALYDTYNFICNEMGLDIKDVLLPYRKNDLVSARYIFATVLMSCTGFSLKRIGSLLGINEYDHTTVIHAKEELARWRDVNDMNYYIAKKAREYFKSFSDRLQFVNNPEDWNNKEFTDHQKVLNGMAIIEKTKGISCHLVLYSDGTGVVSDLKTNELVLEFNDMEDLINEISMIIV